jgi:glycosyltransferase involved in cell wall biosynthesis
MPSSSNNPGAPVTSFARRYAQAASVFDEATCRQWGFYPLPPEFRLSVVVPVFNEAATVAQVIERVRAVGLPCEIVVVDDGSRDGTAAALTQYADSTDVVVVLHEQNRGKGAALRTGFLKTTGDVVVVQDADWEYDPAELPRVIQPIVEGLADVSYGSRYRAGGSQPVVQFWHSLANRAITTLSNMCTGLRLTDMETCYKAFRGDLIRSLARDLQEQGFGIEPELTARLARRRELRWYEVPISYRPRGYADGKKIKLRDGFWAIWCCVKYSFFK